jgi:hypothetical protein
MKKALVFLCAAWLAGCASSPPDHPGDVCSIFEEKDDWYAAVRESQRRWGVPVPVQMAIINRESSFVDDARPPRVRFLGFIPLWRPTSAYGYCQATDATWERYQGATDNGGADRDDFADAADFVGWYVHRSQVELGISPGDAYRQYLAYHEGQGGYRRGSYRSKPALLKAARQVADQARRYRGQLAGCRAALDGALAEEDD